MPVTDVTTHAVCAGQEHLKRHCMLAVPPFDAFELVTDKARLLSTPPGAVCRCHAPTWSTDARGSPWSSSAPLSRGREAGALAPADRRGLGAGQRALRTLPRRARAVVRRPRLSGRAPVAHPGTHRRPGRRHVRAVRPGRLVAEFSHRRLREKPPAGGASVLSESLPVDPRLREFALRLLGPIGSHGVAMMEYKEDRRTGDFVLMEVNGRFWGSLELAVEAGVDFPFLACQLARGVPPEAPAPYRLGVKNRWLLGDLDGLILRLARSAESLDLPDGAPSTARTLLDFLKVREPMLTMK